MRSAPPPQTIAELNKQASAHQQAGELDQAINLFSQIVGMAPGNAVAEHNLASCLGDAGRWSEAETHLQQAFRKGLDAPETWLVYGRCLLALRRLDEAEQSLLQTIKRRPTYSDAHRDLAQLIWMRDGDFGAAMAAIDKALATHGDDPALLMVKAQAYDNFGKLEDAAAIYVALAAGHPSDFALAALAASSASKIGRHTDALAYAERAALLAPNEVAAQTTLIEALLATGDAERAAKIADEQVKRTPLDQYAIARLATAWRLLGDPRYNALYDYKAFVSRSMIDVPNGWPDLPRYVADLAAALKDVHAYKEHPFNQSLRHGSQAPDLLQQPHPAIRALPQALDGPIKRRLAELGGGTDPVRSRNTGNYAFKGIWSVKLHPNGYHVDHVHPQGWLSSACYVETVKDSGREGWIKFGEPGIPTSPALAPEHFEKPEPGLLVLFPSYMWHGTVPFSGDQTRLTFAFDLVPAPA